MLSRVADNLYWMSRYLERAEHTARIVGVHMGLELEQPQEANGGRWERVMQSVGLDGRDRDVLGTLCFGGRSRSSIVSAVRWARDNARQVREQISSEMWEQLNRLYHEVQRADHADLLEAGPEEFLDSIKEGAHLFQGVTDSTMSHGESWQFIQLGRFLERASNLAAMLDVHWGRYGGGAKSEPGPDDYMEWIGLLKCATAFEAYCKAYTAMITKEHAVEFLLLNGTFPHSIQFAVDRVESALASIAEASPSRRGTRVQRLSGRLKAGLGFSQIDEVMDEGLHVMLEQTQRQLGEIHSGVYQAFVSYPIEAALEA